MGGQLLLLFVTTDDSAIILQFETEHYIQGKEKAANDLGIWCKRITGEELESEKYPNSKVYDMSMPSNAKLMFLEQWTDFLKKADE